MPLFLIKFMTPLVIDLPYINPIAFQLGSLAIHWYGIMYLLSFSLVYIFLRREIFIGRLKLSLEHLNDLIFITCLCLLIGARLGYILFYDFNQYWRFPARIFAVWQGGMSFHGGFIGAAFGFVWFWYRIKTTRLRAPRLPTITDSVLTIVPFTLALGRIGNFINAELYGRISDLPWAVRFWNMTVYRHPAQLYEALLHIVAGSFFLITIKQKWPTGVRTALFMLYYSIVRILVEFVREPDTQIGYIFHYFTLGQLLTLPILVASIVMLGFAVGKRSNS